jgi:hypothetical protein
VLQASFANVNIVVFLSILGLIFKNNSARFCFSGDGSSVENTDRIKKLFLEEFLAKKKPTLKEFAEKYANTIDVEEFLKWGLMIAMAITVIENLAKGEN